MAVDVLLVWSHVEQDPLLFVDPLHEVLDRDQAQLYLWLVVQALELPPASLEMLVVRQRLIDLPQGLHIEDEVSHDEALRASLHHFIGTFDHLRNLDEASYIVDHL